MILVDFGNLYHRGIHISKDDILKDINYSVDIVLRMLLNVVKTFGASKHVPLVIAADSKPSWRHKFYVENCKSFPEYEGETYKGNRKKDEDIPWNELDNIMDIVLDGLDKFSDFHVIKLPFAEADDIIAVLAKKCLIENKECWIVSSDKDFRQLYDENFIHIWEPMKQTFVPDMNPKEYLLIHIMVAGDDNIKHIAPRLGKKTALKMLPTLKEQLIINPELKSRFLFNRTLIDFNCIPPDLSSKILDIYNSQTYNYNAMKLIQTFKPFEAHEISKQIINFKLSDNNIATKLNTFHREIQMQKNYQNSQLHNFF